MQLLKYQKTLPKKTEEEKREEDRNYKAAPMKVYNVPVSIKYVNLCVDWSVQQPTTIHGLVEIVITD